ncbi:MAG TPA: TIGR04222 domain-containing membrane protein [Myxococcaceae bacterium]|jgi:uncharacterized protein (TIGR04222 family)
MNPLNWTGEQFLTLYLPLLVVGFIWAKSLTRPPYKLHGDVLDIGKSLEPFEVALLRGVGPFRDAVAASLVHRGVFEVEGTELVASKKQRTDMTSLEKSVVRASGGQPLSRTLLATTLQAEVARMREKLIQKNLLYSEDEARARRKLPLIGFSAVLVLGIAKLGVGIVRERPVGILIVALIFGLIGWVLLLQLKKGRTPLGNRVLSALASEHTALRTTATTEGSLPTLSGPEVALAVALFGTTALATTQMAPMRQYLQTPPPAASSGGGGVAGDCGCGGGDSDWSVGSSSWSSSDSSSSSDSGSSDSSSSSDSGSSDSGGSSCGGCGGGSSCGGGGGD